MLESTLLKVEHSGEFNARRTLAYLNENGGDVFSSEAVFLTEADAVQAENYFEECLSSEDAREAFLEAAQEIADGKGEIDPGEAVFSLVEERYLLERKIPLWHLERFSEEEAQGLKIRFAEASDRLEEGFKNLTMGNIEAYVRNYLFYFSELADITLIRDREMARNLKQAEAGIRGRYRAMESIDPLRLVASVGGLHSPEEFISGVRVINLCERMNYGQTIMSRVIQYRKTDMPVVGMVPLILRFGLLSLSFPQEVVESVPELELYNALRSAVRRLGT